MKVVVSNVNYFNNNSFSGGERHSGASVNFVTHPDELGTQEVGSFSLSYNNITEPVSFFPGEVYELTFNKQEVASED